MAQIPKFNPTGATREELERFRIWLQTEYEQARHIAMEEKSRGYRDTGVSWAVLAYRNAIERFDVEFSE